MSKGFDVWNEFCEDSDSTYFLLHGAVRSSKTFASILAFCDKVENCRPGPIGMMGKTERTLRQNVLDPMRELINDDRLFHLNQGQGELTLFGRKIYLIGAPNIAAVSKIQGKGFVLVYCDEAETYPNDVWSMIGTRTDASGVQIIGTMNPGGPRSWMKVDYLDRLRDVDGRAWHFTLDDNPFLTERVKNRLKKQYTGLWYKRFILGLWVAAEGAIYDMWDEAKHVITSPKDQKYDKIVVGVDYGTSNPTAFIMLGKREGKWIAFKEYYFDGRKGRQKTDIELANDLVKFISGHKVNYIVVDPSAASFKLQLAQMGLPVADADNSVLDGIRTVASGLSSGVLLVDESCSNLIQEFPGYSWDTKAQDRGEDKPIKSEDHALDALRYAFMAAMHGFPCSEWIPPSEGPVGAPTYSGLF
jgi:PBSX family phage terminase large subunit